MQDRFRTRVWDIEEEMYIYDAQFEPDYDFLVNDKKYIPEQCTGVKDKNGKLIYEGDILRLVSEKVKVEYVVKWDEHNAQLFLDVLNDWGQTDFYIIDLNHLEIIGNIHESPELLEGK